MTEKTDKKTDKSLKGKNLRDKKPPSNGRPRYYSAMPLSKLKPYQKNPRHNEEAVEAVANSIEQFGKIAPIICNEKLQICAGHTRFKAALERNEKTFPTLIVPGLTGDRFKAYNIADNQTASIAQWDMQGLAEIIKELQDEGFPTETLGFAEEQLEEILASLEDGFQGETDPDDVPEPPKKVITKRGDLWLLGDHRLLCGDATKVEDVERLMDGVKADMLFTDPPYGQDIGYGRGQLGERYVKGDNRFEGLKSLPFISQYVNDHSHILVFIQWRTFAVLTQFMPFDLRTVVVWDKGQTGLSGGGFAEQHEWLCIFLKGKAKQNYYVNNIWQFARIHGVRKDVPHPTMKPVALICQGLEVCSKVKDKVLDPYLGSGTTMIAAEKLNRKCYGMEIEPIYVDVSVRRWQNFTGKKAVLIRKGKESKITMPDVQEAAA